jgi:membrane-associated phospholipid phosphatase
MRGSWGGWAMPSRPVAILAATLVGVLYTLVPVGRWRQLGKWVATGLVAAFGLARIHLGVDAPTDVLVGAVIGVAVSVAAYRLFVPNEVFPVTYKGAAAPTWMLAVVVARRSARRWRTSSG